MKASFAYVHIRASALLATALGGGGGGGGGKEAEANTLSYPPPSMLSNAMYRSSLSETGMWFRSQHFFLTSINVAMPTNTCVYHCRRRMREASNSVLWQTLSYRKSRTKSVLRAKPQPLGMSHQPQCSLHRTGASYEHCTYKYLVDDFWRK